MYAPDGWEESGTQRDASGGKFQWLHVEAVKGQANVRIVVAKEKNMRPHGQVLLTPALTAVDQGNVKFAKERAKCKDHT